MAGIAAFLPTASTESSRPPSGRVFKVERGAAGEKVAYVRVFQGSVRTRQRLDLPDGRLGKVSGVQVFEDGHWVRAEEVGAGRIGRLHGLSSVRVGDGFGEALQGEDHHFPPPTLEACVEAVDPAKRPALRLALAQLADQDPLIATRLDDDGRPTVSLYGRVQQEVLGATLAEEHGIEVEFSDASVIHVERPRRTAVAVERFNTPTNPHHATLGLRIAPGVPGSGLRFELDVLGRDLPLYLFKNAEGFATAIRRHVSRTLEHGLFGWQVTDCRVTVTAIGYTSADGPPSRRGPLPTAHDFRLLTPLVLRQALARAGVRVCEPVLRIDLEVPTDDAPSLARLLGRWGAELTSQMSSGDLTRLRARLAAVRLHELQHQLPDLTGGEGTLESRFDGFEPVRGRPPARLGWKGPEREPLGV